MECVADFEGIRRTGCDRRIVGWIEPIETQKIQPFCIFQPDLLPASGCVGNVGVMRVLFMGERFWWGGPNLCDRVFQERKLW